ncbi:hypothetical protein [Burkholderia sp. A2]|uniref:hypothetical protein n=1 Tax=Burkholderia sp. A2 TaxID=236253 RepID=UPI003525775D
MNRPPASDCPFLSRCDIPQRDHKTQGHAIGTSRTSRIFAGVAAKRTPITGACVGGTPIPAHGASLGGNRNFAGHLAGIFITTFTGVMPSITTGSFVVPLAVAGVPCVLVVGKAEPSRPQQRGASGQIVEPNAP